MTRKVTISIVLSIFFGVIFSGCQTEEKGSGEEHPGVPKLMFLTTNLPENLSDTSHNDKIAMLMLSFGRVLFEDIMIKISADGDDFYELTGFTTDPNNDSMKEWNVGEQIITTEANVPTAILDKNGDWPSQEFWIRIFYLPTDTIVWVTTIDLEPSQP